MYLVINKCVTAVKVSNFSGHYLRNRSTLDRGVLGYIGIVQHKEHSPEVLSIPSGTPCINQHGPFGNWTQGHSATELLAVFFITKNLFPCTTKEIRRWVVFFTILSIQSSLSKDFVICSRHGKQTSSHKTNTMNSANHTIYVGYTWQGTFCYAYICRCFVLYAAALNVCIHTSGWDHTFSGISLFVFHDNLKVKMTIMMASDKVF